MATNNINMNSAYPPAIFEGWISRAEDIPLLRVISVSTLVCPLSKKFFSDPVRLPCGHVFDRSAMTEWYRNNAVKICPMTLCQKPYDQEEADPLRKELAQSFNKELHRPNEGLRKIIHELYSVLADSQEKQQIKAAIDFFVSGELSQGINQMTVMGMRSANGQLYLPILHFMKMHMQSVSNQINHLIQQAGIPPIGHRQIQGLPSPIPVIGTGMSLSQSLSAPSGSSGMGLELSLASNPPLSLEELKVRLANSMMEKIQGSKGTVTSEVILTSDEECFIKTIKTGGLSDLRKYKTLISKTDLVIDENGNTPLLWIIRNHPHPTTFVETLLKWGADPNAQNNDGQTALHLALQKGTVQRKQSMDKIVEKLIERGARVDSRDKRGLTPLQSATANSGISVLESYLANEPANQSRSLKRPLENAFDLSEAKRLRSERSISEEAEDSSAKTKRDRGEKSIEAENEDSLLKEKIQEKKGDVTSQVLLLSPSEQLFIDTIKSYIESGRYQSVDQCAKWIKNIDIVMDEKGNTPLLWVVENYKRPKKVVEVLLKWRANPNAQNDQGETALHLVSKRKQRDRTSMSGVLEKLVEFGACVDSKDKQGQTPLHLAAKTNRSHIVIDLLKRGAKDDITDHRGQRPIDIAKRKVKWVLQHSTEVKKGEGIPISNTGQSLTFENGENDDFEAREAGNESVAERLSAKNDEKSLEEDIERLFASTDGEEEFFPTGINEEKGFFTDTI